MPFYVIEKCDSTLHITLTVRILLICHQQLATAKAITLKKKKRKGGKTKEKQENLCYRKFHNLDTGQVLV